MSSSTSAHHNASSHRPAHRPYPDPLPPLSTAPRSATHVEDSPSPSPASASSYAGKKKYGCHICHRGFTTSGHLARHARVHTGERNHKCPFPGCETRCSRQDNLQQHYRIHMSPGSRRTSGAVTRAHMTKQQKATSQEFSSARRRTRSPPPPLISGDISAPKPNPHCITSLSPLASPAISSIPPPPDTPPPLAQAYRVSQPPESVSSRSSNRSTPEASYPSPYLSSSALHPSARISHSPEATYATTSKNHLAGNFNQNVGGLRSTHWDHSAVGGSQDLRHSPTDGASYGYGDADQAPSPTSSAGRQLPSQPHSAASVSPQSPYGYAGHYGLHNSNAAQIPNITGSRGAAPSVPSLRHSGTASPPPPPLMQATTYNGYPASSAAILPHDPLPASAIAHQPYPHHYLAQTAQSHHYSSHGTPAQSRQNSPPVVLAPIQNDRLTRSTSQTMPRTSSHTTGSHQSVHQQHGVLPVERPHVGLTSSYTSHMHHPQPHHGQTQAHYPYSSYSTLSTSHSHHHSTNHHDSWRSDTYHNRPVLTHTHSMPPTGLAV